MACTLIQYGRELNRIKILLGDKQMKKRIRYLLAGAGCLLGALSITALTARSSPAGDDPVASGHGFSNRSIEGHWGFNSDLGLLLPPVVPEPVPTIAMGRIFFDGEGRCSTYLLTNTNGDTVAYDSSSCTYSVNRDGIGTAEAAFPGAPITDPLPFSFVIVDRGREILFMNTKFLVASFRARRQ